MVNGPRTTPSTVRFFNASSDPGLFANTLSLDTVAKTFKPWGWRAVLGMDRLCVNRVLHVARREPSEPRAPPTHADEKTMAAIETKRRPRRAGGAGGTARLHGGRADGAF